MFRSVSNNNRLPSKAVEYDPKTAFRYFEMKKNGSYELDEANYFHFLFLAEGELKTEGLENVRSSVKKGQFLFIDKKDVKLKAIKSAKFVLFSVNRYYCKIDPLFKKYIRSIISGLKKEDMPIYAPRILATYYQELMDLWSDRLDDSVIEEIKRKELIIVLTYLFSNQRKEDEAYSNSWLYGYLSLS